MTKFELLELIEAISLYQKGKTLKEIANKADCVESTVSLYLKEKGIKIRPRGVEKSIYPIGTVIGNWKVISEDTKSSGSRSTLQFCECIVCGYLSYVQLNNVLSRKSTRCVKCKSSKILLDDGTVDIDYVMNYYFGHVTKSIQHRDKVSALEFNITPEYLKGLYSLLNGKCAISGIPLDLRVLKTSDLTLSLDRINSNIGYIEGNVQWVHKDINMMKQSYNLDYFKEMCCKVAEQNGYSKCN